ncbi:hypothetical protein [Diaphorobacter aerolatus]|uniref:Uncharacterized protein n=1 Tax=Diaphorobacter aerolatus TaxID=1288495 RepID=A0A7H0GKI0_9BURK|nr:hypothetical protein [Diaphorobacter aerolatus]QNP48796.1 hypothetical protein H9K75_00720 [Diaphorobacter aerolatus]
MKNRSIVAMAALFACSFANAEGFTAYFVQRINNNTQLSNQVTCEVLNSPGGQLEAMQVVNAKDKVTDWDGKSVTSAVILAPGFSVSAAWDPAKGCKNEDIKSSVPVALTKMP